MGRRRPGPRAPRARHRHRAGRRGDGTSRRSATPSRSNVLLPTASRRRPPRRRWYGGRGHRRADQWGRRGVHRPPARRRCSHWLTTSSTRRLPTPPDASTRRPRRPVAAPGPGRRARAHRPRRPRAPARRPAPRRPPALPGRHRPTTTTALTAPVRRRAPRTAPAPTPRAAPRPRRPRSGGSAAAATSMSAATHRVGFGQTMTLTGLVTDATGTPLPGEAVVLQERGPRHWRSVAEATTDDTGVATARRPRRSTRSARFRWHVGAGVNSRRGWSRWCRS